MQEKGKKKTKGKEVKFELEQNLHSLQPQTRVLTDGLVESKSTWHEFQVLPRAKRTSVE